MDTSQVETKSGNINYEQEPWNVNASGCGSKANIAGTGQLGETGLDTAAGVGTLTNPQISRDTEFNEQCQQQSLQSEWNSGVDDDVGGTHGGSSVKEHIGGSGGIHTAVPPFLDEKESQEQILHKEGKRRGPKMNAIEVKLAGMHSNIGFMEADLAEADLRNSLILEDSVADVDTTADKERIIAECNDIIDEESDSNLESDLKVQENSTSALLEEIAQTISAIEESHKDYGMHDGTFEIQDGVYEVQDGIDNEIAYNVDTGEPDIDIPKFSLDFSTEDSDVIKEASDEEVVDVCNINVELDSNNTTNDTIGMDHKIEKSNLDVDINSNAKVNQGDIDSSMNLKNYELNSSVELTSPFSNGSGGEMEFNVDTGEPVLVSPSGSNDQHANGVDPVVDPTPDTKVSPESCRVRFDLDDNDTDSESIPSKNTSVEQNVKMGDKKKKSGFHFNFPWFGGKKSPPTKQAAINTDADIDPHLELDTKHAADVSVGTDDLPGGSSDDQEDTMVADVKAGGDTATLHSVTDEAAPKKPPRDPSVDSEAEVSDYNMEINIPEVDNDDFQMDLDMPIILNPNVNGLELNTDSGGTNAVVSEVDIDVNKFEATLDNTDGPEYDVNSIEKGAPELPSTFMEVNTSLESTAHEPTETPTLEVNANGSLDLKTHTNMSDAAKELQLELDASKDTDSTKLKSGSLEVKSPELKPSSPKIKAHKQKSVTTKSDSDARAKRKKKYFTLPNLHLRSSRPHQEKPSHTASNVNGSVDGSSQSKAEGTGVAIEGNIPDVNVDTKVGSAVSGEGDINVKEPQSNSLPRDSKLSPTEESPSDRKTVIKKRSFIFPAINFSFPTFGAKRKSNDPAKNLSTEGVSLEADLPSRDMDDHVTVHMVEEVQIQPQVKTTDMNITKRLEGLGGYDDTVEENVNPNLPDICQSTGQGINTSINGQPSNSDVRLNTDLKIDGDVSNNGDLENEDVIKPIEGSINFSSKPLDLDFEQPKFDANYRIEGEDTTQGSDNLVSRSPVHDIDYTKLGEMLSEMNFGGMDDVDLPDDVQNGTDIGVNGDADSVIIEGDVSVHDIRGGITSDHDGPRISVEDKLEALAALEIAFCQDGPSSPLDADVNVDVDVGVEVNTSKPDINTSKGTPELKARGSYDDGNKLPDHMDEKMNNPSPRPRPDFSLDVESPDLSIGTPSIDLGHSEASFEFSTKSNNSSLKKEKKKMKKKKKKEKKDGKKKKGGGLDMSIDLESDGPSTSTPIKSHSKNCRHIPRTPDSTGNTSLEGAIAVHSNLSSPSYSESPRRPHSVVIAIDFGTTFSGYAYSFTRDPGSIQIMRKWEGGDPGVSNMKTPTTLLLTPEGEFHSFGFTARDFYHDMDHTEALNWLYFDKFKLVLHNDPDLCMTTEISAANGRKLPAIKVFEHALRFFREHAIEELCDQSTDGTFDPDEIRWVLTVPAIWKQPAKQFMRQAAYLAGIASHAYPEQLLIALEPEAASICIRELRMKELLPEKISQRHKWIRTSMQKAGMDLKVADGIRNGTRYMVVDCGGGTVDITVHEVEDQFGTLKELHKATGGACGSVNIDNAFEALLVDIFGQLYIEEYKIKRPAGWVDLMIAFEARKRNANPWKSNPLNVSLPFSFIDYYKKYTNGLSTVEEEIARYGNSDVTWSAQGMLRFTPEGMKELFRPTIMDIIKHVEDILNKEDLAGVNHLFLAGGFAQSPLLQTDMRRKFNSRLRVVIPCDVGLTILKGAVMFGLDPTAVRVRRSRLTYGVGVLNRFDPNKHPKEKYVMKDHREWCKDVFETFVKVDQSVAIGEQVVKCYTPARPNQKTLVINIYSSSNASVQFVTEEHVTQCGTLRIDVSEAHALTQRRKLHVSMQYGETEIKVSAVDESTGKCVQAAIDFLNK